MSTQKITREQKRALWFLAHRKPFRTRHDFQDKSTVTLSGTNYNIMADGSRRRSEQKTWRGKSERRQVIKARIEDRKRGELAMSS